PPRRRQTPRSAPACRRPRAARRSRPAPGRAAGSTAPRPRRGSCPARPRPPSTTGCARSLVGLVLGRRVLGRRVLGRRPQLLLLGRLLLRHLVLELGQRVIGLGRAEQPRRPRRRRDLRLQPP